MNFENGDTDEAGNDHPSNPVGQEGGTSGFNYTGIFGPNGFLSTISNGQEQTTPTISTNASSIDALEREFESTSLASIRKRENLYPKGVNSGSGSRGDVPPLEMVLSIDLISEKIFNLLPTQDLLNCRLVSHRWNLEATSHLKKQIELHFYGFKFSSSNCPNGQSLTEVMELLQNPNSFPCSRFIFTKTTSTTQTNPRHNPSDHVLQNFLSIFGHNIEEITIRYTDHPDSKYVPREKIVMEQIQKHLELLPNLRILSLQAKAQVEWKDDDDDDNPREDNSSLRATDPEFVKIQALRSKDTTHFNENLKVLNLRGTASAKILEQLIQLAPNLKEILLDDENFHYFVEPVNRLHFLKKLWLRPGNSKEKTLENLDKILTVAKEQGNFHPTHIYVYLPDKLMDANFDDLQFQSRIINLINQISHCGAHSVETLFLNGVTSLRGIELPKFMPKLKILQLRNSFHDLDIQAADAPTDNVGSIATTLSNEFCFSAIFPKLQCIRMDFGVSELVKLLDIFQSLNFDPTKTVKSVQLYCFSSEGNENIDTIRYSAELRLDALKAKFPCAQVGLQKKF